MAYAIVVREGSGEPKVLMLVDDRQKAEEIAREMRRKNSRREVRVVQRRERR